MELQKIAKKLLRSLVQLFTLEMLYLLSGGRLLEALKVVHQVFVVEASEGNGVEIRRVVVDPGRSAQRPGWRDCSTAVAAKLPSPRHRKRSIPNSIVAIAVQHLADPMSRAAAIVPPARRAGMESVLIDGWSVSRCPE